MLFRTASQPKAQSAVHTTAAHAPCITRQGNLGTRPEAMLRAGLCCEPVLRAGLCGKSARAAATPAPKPARALQVAGRHRRQRPVRLFVIRCDAASTPLSRLLAHARHAPRRLQRRLASSLAAAASRPALLLRVARRVAQRGSCCEDVKLNLRRLRWRPHVSGFLLRAQHSSAMSFSVATRKPAASKKSAQLSAAFGP